MDYLPRYTDVDFISSIQSPIYIVSIYARVLNPSDTIQRTPVVLFYQPTSANVDMQLS